MIDKLETHLMKRHGVKDVGILPSDISLLLIEGLGTLRVLW